MSLASIQRTATKLCTKFGRRDVVFNRYAPRRFASGDTEKGAAISSFTASAVVLPLGKMDNSVADGTLAGKKIGLFQIAGQVATFVPRSLDEVVVPSFSVGDDYAGTWQVMSCNPIAPNGLPITYGVRAQKL